MAINPWGVMAATGTIQAGTAGAPNPNQVGKQYPQLLGSFAKGQPQVLQMEQQYKPQYAQLGLSDFQNLLPGAVGSLDATNPLYSQLSADASSQLGLGSALDPSLASVLQQSIRGGQAARGMGYGPSDALAESRGITELGNQLALQRQGYAQNVAGGVAQFQAPAVGFAQNTAAGAGPTIAPGNDIFGMDYNAIAAANIANLNAQAGIQAGGIGSSVVA